MKRPRPPLHEHGLGGPDALLTTADVSHLLRVHPKHVYRLLRRGLPGHRVGGEWRFSAAEVKRWSGLETHPTSDAPAPADARASDSAIAGEAERSADQAARTVGAQRSPPLLAANGDLAIELLLHALSAGDGTPFGFVQADRGEGLALMRRGAVLCAGYHGDSIPTNLDGDRLAFIHLVDRQIALALRRGSKVRSVRQIGRARIASRPNTAGVRASFDAELRRQGLDPAELHGRAEVFASHRDVACAVARGEADVGVTSAAWAHRVGVDWLPLVRERYGLIVRASELGDPRIVRLCEVAQSASFRREVGGVCGYQVRSTGSIIYAAASTRSRKGVEESS